MSRLRVVLPTALLSLGVMAFAAEPTGTITWGVHVTLATRWLDTAETDAGITPFLIMYALHDALVKPMPSGLNTPSLAESRSTSKDGAPGSSCCARARAFTTGIPSPPRT
jgi:peptide/nickel transport system substrate-binding protein